jgi:hypothetical protein
MRLPGLAIVAAATLAILACSSTGSSGTPTGSSLAGTWCSAGAGPAFAGYVFSGSSSCQFDVQLATDAEFPMPGQGLYCSQSCTYTLSGNTLTMTATEVEDGGTVSTTCRYTLTTSSGGDTMEIQSDGSASGCPSYDVTVERIGPSSSCSFGC